MPCTCLYTEVMKTVASMPPGLCLGAPWRPDTSQRQYTYYIRTCCQLLSCPLVMPWCLFQSPSFPYTCAHHWRNTVLPLKNEVSFPLGAVQNSGFLRSTIKFVANWSISIAFYLPFPYWDPHTGLGAQRTHGSTRRSWQNTVQMLAGNLLNNKPHKTINGA